MTGRRLIFAAGPLAAAVYASAALPGIVPPLELDGYRLIDGGFGEPVPVETCRYLGAGRVIAVDVLGRPPASAPAATLDEQHLHGPNYLPLSADHVAVIDRSAVFAAASA